MKADNHEVTLQERLDRTFQYVTVSTRCKNYSVCQLMRDRSFDDRLLQRQLLQDRNN